VSKLTDKKLIEFTEFVATKFSDNHKPWVYSRDLGDLDYIRYSSDYTGYNHWTKRLKRAFTPDKLTRRWDTKKSLWEKLVSAWWHVVVALEKDKHLPDGVINGIPTFWEEDGEYIAMMQPIVGQKVIDFLKAEPEHPHAKAILSAMREAYEASWGKNKDKEND
jgi:hypothetical protein